jgi:DNA-binding response OmpR family regulator
MATTSILCIDDEPAVLLTRKIVLETAGYLVSTTSTAHDGLRLVKAFRFDILLLDCIPDWQLLAAEAKRVNPGMAITVCTGDRELTEAPFVDMVIHKPLPPTLLLKSLRGLLALPIAA